MTDNPTTAALDSLARGMIPMDPTAAYRRLSALVASRPNLKFASYDPGAEPVVVEWIGKLHAVLSAMKRSADDIALKTATSRLVASGGDSSANEIMAILYRALAAAELAAPASEQGAFIAAGHELDAYAAISKVLASAEHDLLIVDPYMDGKALIDFLPAASAGVTLRVLVDEHSIKPTLRPAAERWLLQFGADRSLEIRVAAPRTLHDRLILVDATTTWILTQSLKNFADRAHGSLTRTDDEAAIMKVIAYEAMWSGAKLLNEL